MRVRLALIVLLFCFILPAFAQDKTIPQGIISEPAGQKLSIDVRLNQDCFVPKQRSLVHFRTDQDAYVYIYNIDAKGEAWLLFPNGFSRDARVSKGEHLLPDSDKYSIVIEGPPGIEYIQAIASLYPIPSLEYQGNKPFRLLSRKARTFAKELEKWLEKNLPKGSWATDWIKYSVSLGKLIVSSWPSEARVYVDRNFLGTTQREREDELAKLELPLGKGYHRVQVAKEGYGSRSHAIYVGPCKTRELEFWLERPGRVLLESYPRGAAIHVDGQYEGQTSMEIELEAGWHVIKLWKPEHKTWSRKIWLEAGEKEEIYARLRVNSPPLARAEFTPSEPLIGEEIVFDASGSYDPDGSISNYRWDFDNDGHTDAEGAEVSRKFQRFGRQVVRLTVTDEDGGSDSISLAFLVRARPIAEFIFSPKEPLMGNRVLFDASDSHDPDGAIVSYKWDFGDGAIARGRSATHVYNIPRTYTVTLLVRDDDGLEGRTTRPIEVVRGGVLSISSTPQGAKVYLNGEYIGITPLTTPKLVEGNYRITLKREGYKDWSTVAKIPEKEELRAELVPRGRLSVWSDPPDARVYLDSHPVGKTTAQGLTVYTKGEHLLVVVRCGYRAWAEEVALKSGETRQIRAQLEPVRELSIESHPPGAKIYLDGRYLGETPVKIAIEPTLGELVLIKEGYKRWSTSCITTLEIGVSLQKNEPPVARIAAPDKGLTLEEFGFSARGSTDSDGRIVEYRWDFGDGATASGKRANHRYERPGSYQVRLTVVDDGGTEDSVTKDILIGSHPPLVQLSGPAVGEVGEELTFSAEGSEDPDGEIVAYRWGLGDGETASGLTITHRFREPGTYKVKLTAVDDYGVETAGTMEVEVLTQLELIISHLQDLIVPVPAMLVGNIGQNENGTRSIGLAIGAGFTVGGSVSFTGDEVPNYYPVPPQSWQGEAYNRGPELEVYTVLGTPFLAAISLQCGVGLAFQERIHIATMPASQMEAQLTPQRAVVKPNGYGERQTFLTMLGGISIRLGNTCLSLDYHTRRGWVIGIGVELRAFWG